MKLNLGCGLQQFKGFTNVDSWPGCEPDIVCVLDKDPWPFEDNTVEYALFDHSLEHMGGDTESFFHLLKELYRVCKNGAEVDINVPHPRHYSYALDPTHIRPIYPETFAFFSQERNIKDVNSKTSKLGLQTGTNFEIVSVNVVLENEFIKQLSDGVITDSDIAIRLPKEANIAIEINIKLRVVK